MSNRAQHYREAERLMAETHDDTVVWAGGLRERMLYEAGIHATLANTPNEVFNDYLDLTHTEVLREEVVNAPPPDSREWLAEDEPRCEHCGVVGGGHTFECIAGPR